MSSPVIIVVVQGMKPKVQAGKYAIILLYSFLICNFTYIHKYPRELHMYITYKPKPTVSFVTAKNRNNPNLQKDLKKFTSIAVSATCVFMPIEARREGLTDPRSWS